MYQKLTLLTLALWALGGAAWADETDLAPVADRATREITETAVDSPEFRDRLAAQIEAAAHVSGKPIRVRRNNSIDLRVSAPEGVGLAFTHSPVQSFTTGVSINSFLGATVSINAEATFNLVWPKSFTDKCALVVTGRLSHVRFTGLADDVANEMVQRMYGTPITVKLDGASMNGVTGLTGVDCVFRNGVHLFTRGGLTRQIGKTRGSEESGGEFNLSGWWGPALDMGIGVSF